MLSLLDLCARRDSGRLTPEGAVGLVREAIAAREPEVGALVCVDPAPAIPNSGPLAGLAVGIKDIIDTADLPTRMGSPIYDGWRPRADAPVVARLKQLGAVPLAKTTTTPFAFLDPTATRNPHHPGHTPGGSSAGSAAAVAAGMLPLALGTQTGGSIIRPAAFCGVVGVKPSFRLLPTVGVKCYSWALDTLGLFAAGVADAAQALALLADRPAIARSGEVGAPRIGILRQEFCAAPEPEAEAALSRAAQAAERAGAVLRDLTLPAPFGEAFAAHGTLQDYEARQALAWEYATHRDALPPRLRAALDAAQGIDTPAYDDARRTAHHARRGLKDVFSEKGCDVLLTYAAPGAAPAGLDHTGDSRFNRLWTLMGVPCVTLPVDRTPAGLPVGVQVIARFGDDGRALAAAGLIERALRG
ncbi:amidase [Methylobacterium aquaticum]|uniref:Amidase n=1 Tax=Methylobacterium aquaticum TaxID=270351 RepID=A0A0J6SQ98_9HYPH|nr:amidase [Methylobacterium aquaticum]KMO35782.1 amidase [Methylobacterium aquaticum]